MGLVQFATGDPAVDGLIDGELGALREVFGAAPAARDGGSASSASQWRVYAGYGLSTTSQAIILGAAVATGTIFLLNKAHEAADGGGADVDRDADDDADDDQGTDDEDDTVDGFKGGNEGGNPWILW